VGNSETTAVSKTTTTIKNGDKEIKTTIENKSIKIIKGTGGTNLMPFLKQMRDETIAREIPDATE